MSSVTVTREVFLDDSQGRTFSDIVNDSEQPFDAVLEFFNDEDRQRRMEESEIHHNRPPLAGVVRELEAYPAIDQFLAETDTQKSKRLRQAIGVLVRMILESRGWRKTGRKGSLGVRSNANSSTSRHNIGGLAFWFVRAERYDYAKGMPFLSVRERCQSLEGAAPQESHGSDEKQAVPNLATAGVRTNGEVKSSKTRVKRRRKNRPSDRE